MHHRSVVKTPEQQQQPGGIVQESLMGPETTYRFTRDRKRLLWCSVAVFTDSEGADLRQEENSLRWDFVYLFPDCFYLVVSQWKHQCSCGQITAFLSVNATELCVRRSVCPFRYYVAEARLVVWHILEPHSVPIADHVRLRRHQEHALEADTCSNSHQEHKSDSVRRFEWNVNATENKRFTGTS
jgi:hypothetical protein